MKTRTDHPLLFLPPSFVPLFKFLLCWERREGQSMSQWQRLPDENVGFSSTFFHCEHPGGLNDPMALNQTETEIIMKWRFFFFFYHSPSIYFIFRNLYCNSGHKTTVWCPVGQLMEDLLSSLRSYIHDSLGAKILNDNVFRIMYLYLKYNIMIVHPSIYNIINWHNNHYMGGKDPSSLFSKWKGLKRLIMWYAWCPGWIFCR